MSYSQSGEENAILAAVMDKGYPCTFLDIGAFDGVTYSNTRALALAGWKGVLVEPSPRNFAALRENYKDIKAQLVNVALGMDARLIDFIDTGDEYARKAAKPGQSNIWVSQVTWFYILNQFEGPFTDRRAHV